MFIGVKLIFTYLHETWSEVPKVPTLFSLAVIATILIISTIASVIKSKRKIQPPTPTLVKSQALLKSMMVRIKSN
jgi:predicted tellurium resistance membrane protein TerC